MRYAIVADVHGNLPALEAVLDRLAQERYDRLLCLGDVVGYGAQPGECLERLDRLEAMHLQGNHEARLLDVPTPRFSPIAELAIEHARIALTHAQRIRIAEFPLQIRIERDLLCVHGSPDDRDEYLRNPDRMREVLDQLDTWLCVCGHTHVQFVFGPNSGETEPGRFPLRRDARYLINPGSVGQPRDGDPRAAFALLDLEQNWVELSRVPYDIERAAERIRAVGLPEALALRLAVGR